MPKKLKFKPKVKRVKLNPEQAVLDCTCYSTGYLYPGPGPQTRQQSACQAGKSLANTNYYNSYDAIS